MRTGITLLAAFGLTAWACGGEQHASGYSWNGLDQATGQNVSIAQGPMPTGQTFTGVYHSPQIGDVEMVQTGDAVIGRYEYDRGDCHVRATIEGSSTGNLFRFTWREDHRQCGRIQPVTGRGYLLLAMDTTSEVARARLWGRWGYQNDDRGGGPWTAFKVEGRQPTMLQEQGGSSSGGASEGSSSGASDAGTSGSSTGSGDPLQGL